MWQSMFNLSPGGKQQTKQLAVQSDSAKASVKDNAQNLTSTDTLPTAAKAKAPSVVRFDDDWSSRHTR